MNYHLSDSKIGGVYETQIPLEFRVTLEIGSFMKPNTKKISKSESALNRIYKVKELESVKLDSFKNPFEKKVTSILLYHSNYNQKHFFGVYIPEQNQFMVVTSFPHKIHKKLVEMNLAFSKAQKEYEDNLQKEVEVFDYQHFMSIEDASKFIDKYLTDYKSKSKSAFVVV